MADAEDVLEENLLRNNLNLKADLLKVGHQGSGDSSSREFLKKVLPQIAVISVGKNNKYGHPSGRVIKRLERLGASVFRTDKNGDIKITVDDESNLKVFPEINFSN